MEKDLRKKKNLIDWKWQENNMKSLTRQMARVPPSPVAFLFLFASLM